MSERYVDPALNMPRVAPPDAPRDEPRAANTARAEEDTDFELWLIYKSLTENESYDQKISIKDDVFSGRTILSFLGFAAVITFAAVGWSGWNQMAEGQVHSRSLEVKNWQRSNCNGHSNDLVEPGLHSLVIKERLPNSGPDWISTIFGPVRIFDGFRNQDQIPDRNFRLFKVRSGYLCLLLKKRPQYRDRTNKSRTGNLAYEPTSRPVQIFRMIRVRIFGLSIPETVSNSSSGPMDPWTELEKSEKTWKKTCGPATERSRCQIQVQFQHWTIWMKIIAFRWPI